MKILLFATTNLIFLGICFKNIMGDITKQSYWQRNMNIKTFFYLIFLCLTGCYYQLEDEYIVQPNVNSITIPTLQIVGYSGTNITVITPTNLVFLFNLNGRKIYEATIFINGKIELMSNGGVLSNFNNLNSYESGVYEMKVLLYVSSGTNNLADRYGYEVDTFEWKWTVTVCRWSC